MPSARQEIARAILHAASLEWLTTLSLVFGGCCSNAWALELATSQNPHAGALITFAQFLLVSVYGLYKHLTLAPDFAATNVGQKDLYRLVASNILNVRAGQRRMWVAIEGDSLNVSLVVSALSDELASYKLDCKILTYSSTVAVEGEFSMMKSADLPEDAIILVYGPHLHDTAELRSRWEYSVFITSTDTEDYPKQRGIDSSMMIDFTRPTHPNIFSPPSTWKIITSLPRIRLKKRSIPISRWAIQVVLFLLTSLLNNAAFGYNVPMAVHIIFRSGGLVVNMVMGWLIDGRRYNVTQILSVMVVTLGVICTTLSASPPSSSQVSTSSGSYLVGILILTLALVMSGFMGLAQDKAYTQYGRGHWQEAMFYLHFLALPGFAFMWRDIESQVRTVNRSARIEIGFPEPFQTLVDVEFFPILRRRFSVPSFYFPLLLNVGTHLVCVSGVHRLTSRVNSLTVTLVLVVRKAVSLGISVVLLNKDKGNEAWLWVGAALVLGGTIGYATGGSSKKVVEVPGQKED